MRATRNWPADPDRDPDQVDPAESKAEVSPETPGALDPGGEPGRAEEPGPQPEQGGHDVPGRWLAQVGEGGERGVVATDGGGHRHEDAGEYLAAEEAQGREQEPHPGRGHGWTGHRPAASCRPSEMSRPLRRRSGVGPSTAWGGGAQPGGRAEGGGGAHPGGGWAGSLWLTTGSPAGTPPPGAHEGPPPVRTARSPFHVTDGRSPAAPGAAGADASDDRPGA